MGNSKSSAIRITESKGTAQSNTSEVASNSAGDSAGDSTDINTDTSADTVNNTTDSVDHTDNAESSPISASQPPPLDKEWAPLVDVPLEGLPEHIGDVLYGRECKHRPNEDLIIRIAKFDTTIRYFLQDYSRLCETFFQEGPYGPESYLKDLGETYGVEYDRMDRELEKCVMEAETNIIDAIYQFVGSCMEWKAVHIQDNAQAVTTEDPDLIFQHVHDA